MYNNLTLKEIIFRESLKEPNLGPSEMSKKLNAKYNSVKAAFSKLEQEGLLDRPRRGVYTPNIYGIILHLIERIEFLEQNSK